MLRFWKPRQAQSPAQPLGRLEATVMEILWQRGESSVHDVAGLLKRPRAYTTVMTTLDRLYKKGLLERRKEDRAFLYVPRFSPAQWGQMRVGDFMAGFLAGSEPGREMLISSLVEAAGEHDESLLRDLEEKIRLKRKQLGRRTKS